MKANFQEFKDQCLAAGFKVTKGDRVNPLVYRLAEDHNDEIADHPPSIFFQVFNGNGHFVFSSGLGNEFIHLNTLDPNKAIVWGNLISSIEPNF